MSQVVHGDMVTRAIALVQVLRWFHYCAGSIAGQLGRPLQG
jgi:hypothetical protein